LSSIKPAKGTYFPIKQFLGPSLGRISNLVKVVLIGLELKLKPKFASRWASKKKVLLASGGSFIRPKW